MSLAAFGGGFADAFGKEYIGEKNKQRDIEEGKKKILAEGHLKLLQDPDLDPEKHDVILTNYLSTLGMKPKDIEAYKNHVKTATDHLGLNTPEKAAAGTPSPSSPTPATPIPGTEGAPAAPSAAPQAEAQPTPTPILDNAIAGAAAQNPQAQAQGQAPEQAAAPDNTTPQSPMPEAPTQAQPAQAKQPTPMDTLPTIGSSTAAGVADVSELPTNGNLLDPNRGINARMRLTQQQANIDVQKQKALALAKEQEFNRWVDKYRETFGTDPTPQMQRQMQEGLQRAIGAKLGISPKLQFGGTAITGAALQSATGSDTLPNGSPINPTASYVVTRDSGGNILDAQEKAQPDPFRKVEDVDSPTGVSYKNAAGKTITSAARSGFERPSTTTREQYVTLSDGSKQLVTTRSTRTPEGLPGSRVTPASPLPSRGSTPVTIPSNGPRPMPAASVEKLDENRTAMHSMVNTMADVNKDVDLLSDMLNAGKITIALSNDANNPVEFLLSGAASRSLTPREAKFAGNLAHLSEAINGIRGPIGAGAFRSKEAWAAIQAAGVKKNASPEQIRQTLFKTLEFSLKNIAVKDKALAKEQNQAKPTLTPELANAYRQAYGSADAARKAATKAGYLIPGGE